MSEILAGVDLDAILGWVSVTGLVVVGITMAFKGIDLSKRAVKKA